jgi:two-component system, chemotaxis family, chemotaxis protein CheY
MKTLIVEDDLASQEIIQKIISSLGEYDTVENGEEAIHAFQLANEDQAPYDLILMDIMMPKMDGQTALKKIRTLETERNVKKNKQVKVVMLTALADTKNVIQAFLQGGANSYIVKPIRKETLLAKINEIGLT